MPAPSPDRTALLPFQLAAGSAAGRIHQLAGRNNQDAFAWASSPQGLVAVVCDGCGSAPHSEVGARVGARLVANALAAQLSRGVDLLGAAFWQSARADVLGTLGGLAVVLGGDPRTAVADHLLFTAVGAVVTPSHLRCFSSGDGLIAVNGRPTVLGPFPGNAPPYLAYALFEESPDRYRFELHEPLPTAGLESLVLGTDGAAELLDLEGVARPDRDEPPFAFSQLWTDDRNFSNPDHLRRRLFRLSRDAARPDWDTRELRTAPGLLPDDTTLIVLRRPPTARG